MKTIIPQRFREAHVVGFRCYLEIGEARLVGCRIELVAVRADGSELPVELGITRVPNAEPPLFSWRATSRQPAR